MSLIARRTDLDWKNLPPLSWTWWIWLDTKELVPVMRCTGGHMFLIRDNHTIAADGSVSPSMVCPNPPCPYHEFIQLDGWGISGDPVVVALRSQGAEAAAVLADYLADHPEAAK